MPQTYQEKGGKGYTVKGKAVRATLGAPPLQNSQRGRHPSGNSHRKLRARPTFQSQGELKDKSKTKRAWRTQRWTLDYQRENLGVLGQDAVLTVPMCGTRKIGPREEADTGEAGIGTGVQMQGLACLTAGNFSHGMRSHKLGFSGYSRCKDPHGS